MIVLFGSDQFSFEVGIFARHRCLQRTLCMLLAYLVRVQSVLYSDRPMLMSPINFVVYRESKKILEME